MNLSNKLSINEMQDIMGGKVSSADMGCLAASVCFVAACGMSWSGVAALGVIGAGLWVDASCF